MPVKPNVIIVITDDQGYGDLGCTGNPWIQTPCIDKFYADSVRMRDFHVSPLCTPTRGAIMTGHRPLRNGAWATCWGRSILRREEVTMADIFLAGGYSTGLFGKWHLGDNFPYRPQDRGFQKVVAHKGGGVGQTPDFWGNQYFDDTYFHNCKPVQHKGYCTDIWFDEAKKFIVECGEQPFFAFISTNAPHMPYIVDEKYSSIYTGNPNIPEPEFYGMITNIDENFGKLRDFLNQIGIEENTILIFMTDNGTSGGCTFDNNQRISKGYNAGMRGKKGSYYDGGHRVPLFIRWPKGGLTGGRDVDDIAFHVDLLPTLIDICLLKQPEGVKFDGTSLTQLIFGDIKSLPEKRIEFIQYHQDTNPPDSWTNCVLTKRWRLLHGNMLYDMESDPEQQMDVSARYPDIVQWLRNAHEEWWQEISPGLQQYSPISLGSSAENPTCLTAMDVMGDIAWNQKLIMQAKASTGKWSVFVEKEGRYRFSLRRWPEELNLPFNGIAEVRNPKWQDVKGKCICPSKAKLKIFEMEFLTDILEDAKEAVFEININRTGETALEAWFTLNDGSVTGAYYVYVERSIF